ncbi:TPA: hypothetical protein ACLEYZ_005803 [Pseudomonas aeruginosa]
MSFYLTTEEAAELIDGYQAELIKAYEAGHLRAGLGHASAWAAVGRLVGAAGQKTMRAFAGIYLCRLRDHGHDLTYHQAEKICRRILGRGANRAWLLENFATPGRTAANKSPISTEEMLSLEQGVDKAAEAFKLRLRPVLQQVKRLHGPRAKSREQYSQ